MLRFKNIQKLKVYKGKKQNTKCHNSNCISCMTPVGWLLMSFTACGEMGFQKQLVRDHILV